MRFGQRFRRLYSNLDDIRGSERIVLYLTPQCFALDVLHDDEWMMALFIHFVNGTDIRVIESGRGFRLANQPFSGVVIFARLIGEYLDRYFAFKPGVLGQEHFAHAARAELFDDLIMRELS